MQAIVISAEFDQKLNLGDSSNCSKEEELELPTTECNCQQEEEEEEEEEDDDEFSFVCGGDGTNSPISADDIFQNGKIKPIFPLFEVEQMRDVPPAAECNENESKVIDDEAEEGVAYCLWSRNVPAPTESWRKSNSTGFSKLRRFRELLLLQRSQSDGKDAFFFLTEKRGGGEGKGKEQQKSPETETVSSSSSSSSSSSTGQGKKKMCNLESNCHHRCTSEEKKQKKPEKSKTSSSSSSSVQRRKITPSSLASYASSSNNGGNGRRSYLPYRQDLVGFFTSASTISRNVHPY